MRAGPVSLAALALVACHSQPQQQAGCQSDAECDAGHFCSPLGSGCLYTLYRQQQFDDLSGWTFADSMKDAGGAFYAGSDAGLDLWTPDGDGGSASFSAAYPRLMAAPAGGPVEISAIVTPTFTGNDGSVAPQTPAAQLSATFVRGPAGMQLNGYQGMLLSGTPYLMSLGLGLGVTGLDRAFVGDLSTMLVVLDGVDTLYLHDVSSLASVGIAATVPSGGSAAARVRLQALWIGEAGR